MNKLDHCYLEALSEALKGNLGEALEFRNEADALASEGFSFSENYGNKYPFIEEAVNTLLDSYEFTRCVRADGSAYGTRGKCKKGTEAGPADRVGKGKKAADKASNPERVGANRPSFDQLAKMYGPRREGLAYLHDDFIKNMKRGEDPQKAFENASDNQNFYGSRPEIVKERTQVSRLIEKVHNIKVNPVFPD
jgi:hypothetical protein